MSIQGIGSYNPASAASSSSAGSSSFGIDTADRAVQDFLNEVKKSPMERMVDAWLKAHHLTKEDIAKMPPDQQKAIMKEMAKDIADEMKRKVAEKQKGVMADISA